MTDFDDDDELPPIPLFSSISIRYWFYSYYIADSLFMHMHGFIYKKKKRKWLLNKLVRIRFNVFVARNSRVEQSFDRQEWQTSELKW